MPYILPDQAIIREDLTGSQVIHWEADPSEHVGGMSGASWKDSGSSFCMKVSLKSSETESFVESIFA